MTIFLGTAIEDGHENIAEVIQAYIKSTHEHDSLAALIDNKQEMEDLGF